MTTLLPDCTEELLELVRSTPRLLACGAQTKPRLSIAEEGWTNVSLGQLRGIVEYQPDEFTITAFAGTPLAEVVAALAEQGQYLPFDPMFVDAGCTLGGTVAAGTSGPGRFRFGGLRDFILGIQFVDGGGRLLRMGGKVVKNAAGFDLPKFFVGSLGRFGVLTEVTLKVFPRPVSTLTLRLEAATNRAAVDILTAAGSGRWEIAALDIPAGECAVYVRLAGPAEALSPLAAEIQSRWRGTTLDLVEADAFWGRLREASWAGGGPLIKVVLTPAQVAGLLDWMRTAPGTKMHVSSGGNVGYITLSEPGQLTVLDAALRERGMPAVVLRGLSPLWIGAHRWSKVAQKVKVALDPQGRFPKLEE